MTDFPQLQRDGFALLRGAIPAGWLDELRAAFEAGVKPSDQWPVPRGLDWRHSWLDLDPKVQAVCRLPAVLAVAGPLIGERFFLAQVEGREPLEKGGHHTLVPSIFSSTMSDGSAMKACDARRPKCLSSSVPREPKRCGVRGYL